MVMVLATGGFIENFFNDPWSVLYKVMGVILVLGIIAGFAKEQIEEFFSDNKKS
jgi:hypothetical protein